MARLIKTIQEGMPLSRRIENKIRRIVIGPPDCVAIGMGNRCREGAWHLFYDYDGNVIDQRMRYDDNWFFTTKHGAILVNMECDTLSSVKHLWDNLHRDYPDDYFWSVPLWLRISPKWDRTDGHVVSDSPGIPEELTRHFPMRKAYYTRD